VSASGLATYFYSSAGIEWQRKGPCWERHVSAWQWYRCHCVTCWRTGGAGWAGSWRRRCHCPRVPEHVLLGCWTESMESTQPMTGHGEYDPLLGSL